MHIHIIYNDFWTSAREDLETCVRYFQSRDQHLQHVKSNRLIKACINLNRILNMLMVYKCYTYLMIYKYICMHVIFNMLIIPELYTFKYMYICICMSMHVHAHLYEISKS